MKKPFLIYLAIASLIAGCTDDFNDQLDFQSQITTERDENASNIVSITDIENAISNMGIRKTRSEFKSVTADYDEDKSPLVYCVNFGDDDGFIVFSGVKTFDPVICKSETGHFDIYNPIPPVKYWLDAIKTGIRHSKTLSSNYTRNAVIQWQKLAFKSTAANVLIKNRKSRGEGDITSEEQTILYSLIQNKRMEFESQGLRTHGIHEVFSLDEEWQEYINNRAAQAIYPLYDHIASDLSFVVEYDQSWSEIIPNFIEATWDQENGYNQSFPDRMIGNQIYKPKVGCMPLAAGQIMYYYNFPPEFQWDKMLAHEPTKETSDMLYMVNVKSNTINGKYASDTNIDDMITALKSYGYNAIKNGVTHIDKKRPTIVCGNGNGTSLANHAWIFSGSYQSYGEHYYVYYTLVGRKQIGEFERTEKEISSCVRCYYNWGYGGKYDGFYSDPIDPITGIRYATLNYIDDIYPLAN